MAFAQPHNQICLIMDEEYCYSLKSHSQGMVLTTAADEILFKVDEPVLLAQGTIGDNRQIHLAYITKSSELCYTIISPTGEQQTMPLGKVDTNSQRFDGLYIFPIGKVIHIFYASSHITLPDVWRINHLFWNGQTWKSAQLGEVVHPNRPLYRVLIDSRSNLHVLMLTFLGSRSVLLTSIFNGSFYLWSKRQEVLRIPRQVVDMAALMAENDQAFLFWTARQPSSDRFEIGQASQRKVTDFKLVWSFEVPVASDLHGPWLGMGVIKNQGKLQLFAQGKQAILFQQENSRWLPEEVIDSQFPLLQISHKASTFHYTFWGQNEKDVLPPYQQCANNLETFEPISDTPIAKVCDGKEETNSIDQASWVSEASEASETNEVSIVNNISSVSEVYEEDGASMVNKASEADDGAGIASEASDVDVVSIVNEAIEVNKLCTEIEALTEKITSLPEVLTILKELQEKNQENSRLLQELTHKINSPTQLQVAEKKGFWQRWFT